VTRRFRWDDWNLAHIAQHRVSRQEAEYVVRNSEPPFPRSAGDEKQLVWGQTSSGRYLQVIFIFDDDEYFDYEKASLEDILLMAANESPPMYVIHARDLSPSEKHAYRRMR